MTSEQENQPLTRYAVLAGALIVQLILGTLYGYSIFWEPLEQAIFPPVQTVADVRANGLETNGVRPGFPETISSDAGPILVMATPDEVERRKAEQQGYLKYAFSIAILAFAITMVIAGRIQDVTGPRLPALIGAGLMGIGFILAGFMQNSLVFYLSHSALMGALAVVLLLLFHALKGSADIDENPILRWAPYGIMTTVTVLGVGLSDRYVGQAGPVDRLMVLWGTIGVLAGAGIGFAYVCPIAALVKWFPKQKGLVSGLAVAGFGLGAFLFTREPIGAPSFIGQHGISRFFIVHGLVCMAAVSFGAMLLRNPPGVVTGQKGGETNWQDTLKQPAFYVVWLMFFSGAMAGLMVIGSLKPFVTEQAATGGLADEGAKAVGLFAVGVLAVCNALGRVLWGLLSDRIGRTTSFMMMFIAQAVVLFILGQLNGPTGLYIASGLIGFNFGGNFALFPSATADLFGAKNLGANYGWVFTSYGIAGVVGVAAGNLAKEQTGEYLYAFWMAGVLCLISAGLALALKPLAEANEPAAA